MNSIVSVPAFFFNPGTDGQVCCTLSWSIPVHTSWLGLSIPIFYYSFSLDFVCHWFHCYCFFYAIYASKVVWSHVCFYFFCCVYLKYFVCIFLSCHMFDYLSAWCGIILVSTYYFHSDVIFWCLLHFWYHMGLHFWCFQLYFPKFPLLAIFPFFGLTADFLLGWNY